MFSSSTLFTEAMKWSKPLISHKITTCLCVMLATFQSSFKITISSDSFINALSKSDEQYHFRDEEMDTEWVSPKATQLTRGQENNCTPCNAQPVTPDCGAVGIGFPGLKAPGTGPAHRKLLPSYSSLLPQCLEQYLVNGWMNNEWVNNNEWMDEGVAELKEALTHTSALQIAAFRKLHKANFTNALQKLPHCFFLLPCLISCKPE